MSIARRFTRWGGGVSGERRLARGALLIFYTDGLLDFDRKIQANENRLLAAAKVVLESKVA